MCCLYRHSLLHTSDVRRLDRRDESVNVQLGGLWRSYPKSIETCRDGSQSSSSPTTTATATTTTTLASPSVQVSFFMRRAEEEEEKKKFHHTEHCRMHDTRLPMVTSFLWLLELRSQTLFNMLSRRAVFTSMRKKLFRLILLTINNHSGSEYDHACQIVRKRTLQTQHIQQRMICRSVTTRKGFQDTLSVTSCPFFPPGTANGLAIDTFYYVSSRDHATKVDNRLVHLNR